MVRLGYAGMRAGHVVSSGHTVDSRWLSSSRELESHPATNAANKTAVRSDSGTPASSAQRANAARSASRGSSVASAEESSSTSSTGTLQRLHHTAPERQNSSNSFRKGLTNSAVPHAGHLHSAFSNSVRTSSSNAPPTVSLPS